jgi:hypothetical protein
MARTNHHTPNRSTRPPLNRPQPPSPLSPHNPTEFNLSPLPPAMLAASTYMITEPSPHPHPPNTHTHTAQQNKTVPPKLRRSGQAHDDDDDGGGGGASPLIPPPPPPPPILPSPFPSSPAATVVLSFSLSPLSFMRLLSSSPSPAWAPPLAGGVGGSNVVAVSGGGPPATGEGAEPAAVVWLGWWWGCVSSSLCWWC